MELPLDFDPETAKRILENGGAEVVFRQADQKFEYFVKAGLKSDAVSEEVREAIRKAAFLNRDASENLHSIVKNVDLANTNIQELGHAVKNMSGILADAGKLMERVSALSCVNIGLTAVNIAVDAVGFAIIAQNLNGINSKLDGISRDLEKLQDFSVESLRRECEHLVLDFGTFSGQIKRSKLPSAEKLEEFLKQAKPMISSLKRLIVSQSADVGILLDMIYMVLPAYTAIFCTFLKAYWFEEQEAPVNYESFRSIYSELVSPEVKNAIQDHYLLKKGFHYEEVVELLDALAYPVFSEQLDVADQLVLVETFNTPELYQAYEEAIDASVKKRAASTAQNCGEYAEEVARVLCGTT